MSVNQTNYIMFLPVRFRRTLSGKDIQEIESERDSLIKKVTNADTSHDTIINLCKDYEKLCKKKYPEALLPLEITK